MRSPSFTFSHKAMLLIVSLRPYFIYCASKALSGAQASSLKSLLKIKSGSLGLQQED